MVSNLMDQICWQETNYITNVWFQFQVRLEEETKLQNCSLHLLERLGEKEMGSNEMLVYSYTVLNFH